MPPPGPAPSPDPPGVSRYVIHSERRVVSDDDITGPNNPPPRDATDMQPWIPFAVTIEGKAVRIWWRKAG